MRPAFQYPEKDWLGIDACLIKLAPIEAEDRHTIEAIVHRFLWMTERTDPRSPDVVAAKAGWAKIAKHAKALNAALAEMEAMETSPINSLTYAIALDRTEKMSPVALPPGRLRALPSNRLITPRDDYVTWKRQTADAERWAATAARGWPKSLVWSDEKDANGRPVSTKAGHNKSRGDDVDKLIGDLLTFWRARGGEVGTRIGSPSTRFVMAAAGRVLCKNVPGVKMPGAIIDLVRDQRARLDPQK